MTQRWAHISASYQFCNVEIYLLPMKITSLWGTDIELVIIKSKMNFLIFKRKLLRLQTSFACVKFYVKISVDSIKTIWIIEGVCDSKMDG